MMRFFLLVNIFFAWSFMQLRAVPARQIVRTIKQSDSTTLGVILKGDECFHFFSTQDGIPLKQVDNGDYHYMQVIDTELIASGILAHEPFERSEAEKSFLKQHSAQALEQIKQQWQAKSEIRNVQRAESTQRVQQYAQGYFNKSANIQYVNQKMSTIGQQKGLVILVEFSDKKFTVSNANATFDNMMNKVQYKENKQYGSVHDYFWDQSGGKFSLNFDVVGPVKLSKTVAYYGENSIKGDDMHPGEMVAEACKLIRDQVNFKDYDWNEDGHVEQVYVIYSGYGEATGGGKNTIWPHQWGLMSSDYGSPLFLDQVIINTYACSSELFHGSGSVLNGIGTICHEFSHCLGLPDFYNTQGDSFGMNAWSIMDYGNYNDAGNTPSGYTSYEKMFCGWLNPIVLDSPGTISNMKALSEGGDAYIIYNDANKDEYYLLENRQESGWDSKIFGHGMLVLHVDYDQSMWSSNRVNSTLSRQRMTIIPADKTYRKTKESLAGDPYPGTSQNHALTDHTSPASILYTTNLSGTKYLGKPIEEITELNGTISFKFMGGKDDTDKMFNVTQSAEKVDVYHLNGMYIRTANSKQWGSGLQKGIYLLKQGENYQKVILR